MPFGHDVLLRQSFASRKIVENKPRVCQLDMFQNYVNIM